MRILARSGRRSVHPRDIGCSPCSTRKLLPEVLWRIGDAGDRSFQFQLATKLCFGKSNLPLLCRAPVGLQRATESDGSFGSQGPQSLRMVWSQVPDIRCLIELPHHGISTHAVDGCPEHESSIGAATCRAHVEWLFLLRVSRPGRSVFAELLGSSWAADLAHTL